MVLTVLGTILAGAVASITIQAILDRPVPSGASITDPAELSDCRVVTLVEQVASLTGMAVGVENVADCEPGWSSAPVGRSLRVGGSSARQLLDLITASHQRYTWHEQGGVLIVRPVTGRRTPEVLELRVPPFAFSGITVHEALQRILAQLPLQHEPHSDARPSHARYSFRFAGGTLLMALNSLVEPSGGVWNIGVWKQTNERLLILRGFDQKDSVEMVTLGVPR